MSATNSLVDVELYVSNLLAANLPKGMDFHNLQHTTDVVNAANEIGEASGLNQNQLFILQIACWFHDTGYTTTYKGHEDSSMSIAFEYLRQHYFDEVFIIDVMACIAATKMPQQPQDLLQKIICDADMFHLAKDNYPDYAARLRSEWEQVLNLHFTDEGWQSQNKAVLQNHQYFTEYGKTVLTPRKQKNLDAMGNP